MRMILRQYSVVVLSCVALAPTAANAQQIGSTTETVATVHHQDINGTVAVTEQTVTHRIQTNEGDQVVTETYSPSMEGGHLSLSRRIRRTTTATSDGTRTIEEMEERNPVAASDPLRVIRRSVTTVRQSETASYVSERQVFELDVNGRFVPVLTQMERGSRN